MSPMRIRLAASGQGGTLWPDGRRTHRNVGRSQLTGHDLSSTGTDDEVPHYRHTPSTFDRPLVVARAKPPPGACSAPATPPYTQVVSAKGISDELLLRVADELRRRYELDDEEIRALGARLADDPRLERPAENPAFAERFTDSHRETFDRLGR